MKVNVFAWNPKENWDKFSFPSWRVFLIGHNSITILHWLKYCIFWTTISRVQVCNYLSALFILLLKPWLSMFSCNHQHAYPFPLQHQIRPYQNFPFLWIRQFLSEFVIFWEIQYMYRSHYMIRINSVEEYKYLSSGWFRDPGKIWMCFLIPQEQEKIIHFNHDIFYTSQYLLFGLLLIKSSLLFFLSSYFTYCFDII